MYRGDDLLEALHGSIPEWLLLVAALVTRLGDVWVVIGATIAASWLLTWNRTARGEVSGVTRPSTGTAERSTVWPVGVVVGGLAAMTALKYLFALPRPDQVAATPELLPSVLESTYVSSVTLGGYGFPSGHALGATVAYGILALTLPVGTRRRRLVVAGVVILAVSLSRVVLSVHYPGDIVAGIAVGVVYLAAVRWFLEWSPIDRTTTAFGLALGLAAVAIAVSGAGGRSVTYAALAAGGLAVWTIGRPELRSSSPGATYHAESATAILGLLVALVVLEGGLRSVVPAAVLGGLVVVPAVVSCRSP